MLFLQIPPVLCVYITICTVLQPCIAANIQTTKSYLSQFVLHSASNCCGTGFLALVVGSIGSSFSSCGCLYYNNGTRQCYKLSPHDLTYQASKKRCEEEGGMLAVAQHSLDYSEMDIYKTGLWVVMLHW